jgi:RNA recognition motif-containing protein
MSIDPFTGRNPSYCFVDMHSQKDADRAMDTMQGQALRGRPIRINHKTERRQHNGPRLPSKTYDRGWKPKEITVPVPEVGEDAFAFDRWSRTDAAENWTKPDEERRRLWVGGLPRIQNQDSLQVEMRNLFKGYKVEAVSKLISPRASQRSEQGSQYMCFVDMASLEEAKHAVEELNGTPNSYGGAYKVRIAQQKRGPTLVEREQLGATSKIYVGGLSSTQDQDTLEAEIRQLFDGNHIISISKLMTPRQVTSQRDGNDPYFCFVDLLNPEDARDAVEQLDGAQTPHGGMYKIRYARERSQSQRNQYDRGWRNKRGREEEDRDSRPLKRDLGRLSSWRREA